MASPVWKDSSESRRSGPGSSPEPRLNGPAVTEPTAQPRCAVTLAGTTVEEPGKTQGYLGGTEGLEKQSYPQLGVPMTN